MHPYNDLFDPQAPALNIRLQDPTSGPSKEVLAQIDTGSDITVLPGYARFELKLKGNGSAMAVGLQGVPTEHKLYGVLVQAPKKEMLYVEAITWDGEHVLLGRDILNQWTIVLDGPALSMTI